MRHSRPRHQAAAVAARRRVIAQQAATPAHAQAHQHAGRARLGRAADAATVAGGTGRWLGWRVAAQPDRLLDHRLGLVVLGDVAAPKERGRYYAYFSVVYTTAGASGPALGGFIADHLHWTVIFWINLPLGLIALALSYTALRRLPRHERPHRLDIVGAVLIVLASASFMLAINQGGVRFAWTSPPILTLLVAAAGSAHAGKIYFTAYKDGKQAAIKADPKHLLALTGRLVPGLSGQVAAAATPVPPITDFKKSRR